MSSTRSNAFLVGVALVLGELLLIAILAGRSIAQQLEAERAAFVEHGTGQQTLLVAPGACIVQDTTLSIAGGWIGADSVRAPCPVIVYNPRWFSQRGFSDENAIFVLLHEYGHMVLQHRPSFEIGPEASRAQERQADCFAARNVATRWPEVLPTVLRFWLDIPAEQPEEVYHDQPRARAQLILECANAAVRSP